jgi:hypothetical protein
MKKIILVVFISLSMNVYSQMILEETPIVVQSVEHSEESPYDEILRLCQEGIAGLDVTDSSIAALEEKLNNLSIENEDQRRLHQEAMEMIAGLKSDLAAAKNNVDIAVDRMMDAEGYALYIDAQNEILKEEAKKLRGSSYRGFAVGAISFGVGVPLIIDGIQKENWTQIGIGAGVSILPGAIWFIGNKLFGW